MFNEQSIIAEDEKVLELNGGDGCKM
jgi:hypothetical protein